MIKPRWHHKLALLALSLGLVLVLGEVFARLCPDAQAFRVSPSSIPGLAYQPLPGMFVVEKGYRQRINSWGFQAPEFPKEKPAGVFRIFALGDSIVYGQGAGPDRFTRLLEDSLNADAPQGRRYQVVNTGVPSYSTCQELVYLKEHIDAFSPDLVLVGYAPNDPEKPRAPFGLDLERGRLPFHLELYHAVKNRSALARWLKAKISVAIVRLRGHTYYGPPVDPNNIVQYVSALHDPAGEYWKACAACLSGFGKYQKAERTPVLLVIFPMFTFMEKDSPLAPVYKQVENAARADGLAVINLYDHFAGTDVESIKGDGMHPTGGGHRLIAEIIRKRLLAQPSLLAGRGL